MKKTLFIVLPLIWILLSCSGSDKNNDTSNPNSTLSEIELLNKQIDENPEIDSLYYQRALYFLKNNKLNKALGDISTAIDLNPEKTENYILLGDIYLAQGNIESCRKSLLKAFDMDPQNPEPSLKLAELNLFLEDYEKTFLYLDKAIDIDEYNAQAFFMRGYAKLEQKDTLSAIANLQHSTQLDAEYFNAFILLGYVMEKMGDPIAGNYFKSAVNINSMSLEARYAYGFWLQNNGQFNRAIQQYDAILNIDDSYEQAWYNIAYIYLVYFEDFQGAADKFSRAIEADPQYAEAYFNRGLAYEEMGKFDLAETDYRKALSLRENYEKAIEGLNRVLEK